MNPKRERSTTALAGARTVSSTSVLSTALNPAPPSTSRAYSSSPRLNGPTGLLPGAGSCGGGTNGRSAVPVCHGFCSTPCQQAKTRRPPARSRRGWHRRPPRARRRTSPRAGSPPGRRAAVRGPRSGCRRRRSPRCRRRPARPAPEPAPPADPKYRIPPPAPTDPPPRTEQWSAHRRHSRCRRPVGPAAQQPHAADAASGPR